MCSSITTIDDLTTLHRIITYQYIYFNKKQFTKRLSNWKPICIFIICHTCYKQQFEQMLCHCSASNPVSNLSRSVLQWPFKTKKEEIKSVSLFTNITILPLNIGVNSQNIRNFSVVVKKLKSLVIKCHYQFLMILLKLLRQITAVIAHLILFIILYWLLVF